MSRQVGQKFGDGEHRLWDNVKGLWVWIIAITAVVKCV